MNFLEQAIAADLETKRYDHIVTRFPPEPNGFLHIGHAKAILIDFGTPKRFDQVASHTNLRLDDTNPTKEDQAYIDAIQEDVRWLGFDWKNLCFASDYFQQLFDWACLLIEKGYAYVDDQTAEQIRETRGTLTEPGQASPFRDRPAEESLDLFHKMKQGEFPDGSRVLRAKIDMASPNLVMRDPVLYRIVHAHHPRTGNEWCIYPMYDWAHGQSDWIEGITHSLCDTSFEIHRPLYEWCVQTISDNGGKPADVNHLPRQIEFARGNITYLVTSKRKLLELIEKNIVTGWDDPRMPTIRGMRRRGYTPQAIVRFWDEVGVAKRVNNIEFAKLENVLRDDLNKRAQRRMAVLDPIKLVVTNLPEDHEDSFPAVNNPEDESAGKREVKFSSELWIERNDFMIDPPKKFFRLAPDREVRLRYAFLFTAKDYKTDEQGNVTEVHGTIDPDSRGGNAPDGRKVKGTIHWVSCKHALPAEVRLYEHLFTAEDPTKVEEGHDWLDNVNQHSLAINDQAKIEPALADDPVGEPVQFERLGYYVKDPDSMDDKQVFNRTITLRDTWARVNKS